MMAAAIVFPIISGIIILCCKEKLSRRALIICVSAALLITQILAICMITIFENQICTFTIMDNMDIVFSIDTLSKLFIVFVSVIWIFVGVYAFTYMTHEHKEGRFFGFYLITLGVLIGLGAAGNLITMYAFFEFMTLASFPLVVHNQSREAVMASLKYLFYSFFGAYMAFFGVFFLYKYGATTLFTAGGVLDMPRAAGNETILLISAVLMIIGFGAKAGMFPLHAWLSSAHPVAPAPASSVLSGIIVKGGVLAIIRVVFYLFGAEFLRGTWVQYTVLTLSLTTVLMGSMLAYREDVLKKRLAYSTVSQASYILFGIALLNPAGMTGALLHVICHAFIKCGLFLSVGAIIFKTGITDINGISGIGKKMPITIWCYTFVSLGLIGIPPTGGFISKWYLAAGSLQSGISVFAYLGPIILLVSALLTAGYLLPITLRGFFPGENFDYKGMKKCEPDLKMLIPMIVFAAVSLYIGMFPTGLVNVISDIVSGIV